MTRSEFSIVIPTIGRPALQGLITALETAEGPRPQAVVIVDDRREPTPLPAFVTSLPIRVLRSGGRGPAAARNIGWRATTTRWVCFLDDDVIPGHDWFTAAAADLRAADTADAAASQAEIRVPVPIDRRVSDDERRTTQLATARWITADMAYRRDVLVQAGGFDERFPRAYREDSDLAVRVVRAGHHIIRGTRSSTHPVATSDTFSCVRAQVGNRDNALMRRKHGWRWRRAIGEGPGRMPAHLVTTAAIGTFVIGAVSGRRRTAGYAALTWLALTAQFALRRIAPGPKNPATIAALTLTSTLIPPVAVGHRLVGEWTFRRARRNPPLAVLFDRDDTIIEDGPFLNDPDGVRPKPGAYEALSELREKGLLVGVVTNQSGVARGLITDDQLRAVNARVESALGPFHCWQICVHDTHDGCPCRKPEPGMVLAAAADLDVDPSRCVLIGDTGGDVSAALNARARAVLVPTARTLPHEVTAARRRARVAPDLSAAVAMVLRECR
ncbi:HAD-IIIA family hydrolase [Mycolicibacterium frederiksbergense]|uniref:HAD-IIIA family hydrolase n=1 Tax=Mycolicibacterium frederiksbergense TaxID=117567 RepID=UPI00265BEEA4|nr:HAD-IIIA family hydrolase [Mycolicibacterium frederiksbergense]MDO0973983.1 HAD-IIIA family hydrolase [Mycolicibacterium frederiksbergense]